MTQGLVLVLIGFGSLAWPMFCLWQRSGQSMQDFLNEWPGNLSLDDIFEVRRWSVIGVLLMGFGAVRMYAP